jgi:integrase
MTETYLEEYGKARPMGKTKKATLGAIAKSYLHFHDLRHGVSRLFEMGWDIPCVASVSGHRDWNSLRRYTHLNGRGDPYAGWDWLPRLLASGVEYADRTLSGLSRCGSRR